MNLTEEDLLEKLPSGRQTKYINRVSWAITYLKKAGLIESVTRGTFRITEDGINVLEQYPVIDNKVLRQFKSFVDFIGGNGNREQGAKEVENDSDGTPQELLEQAYQNINNTLAEELLTEIMKKDSDFFEKLVIQLLLKMGYGGTLEDAGQVTPHSNDGGIDGIIKEDKLGFSQIYIQAKRWDLDTTVSRPEIQKFSGALLEAGADKGLFITTTRFSSGAVESANKQHIVLVDGQKLAKLMIEYDLGVSTAASYHIKNLDTDFFNEEELF
jgi:restriction system protein